MLEVDVRILDERLHGWGFPHWGSPMAAGLDLFACLDEPLVLWPQAPPALIPAGFALRIADPEWAALIYARSGQAHRHGLVLSNAVGVVDPDYQGGIMVSAWNRNPEREITVVPGERVAQLVFTRVARPRLHFVDSFEATSERGEGGFGSTGATGQP